MSASRLLLLALAGSLVASPFPAPASAAAPPLGSLRALPTPAAPASGEPRLAVSPDGTVFLSWFERRDSTRHALRIARLEGNRWSGVSTVAEGDSFFVNWADVPALLAHDRDRLAIAWPWKHGGGKYSYDVRIAQSRDGGRTWGPVVVPHRDDTPTEHGFVSLVAEAGGTRAVWLDGRRFAEPAEATAAGGATKEGSSHGHDHGGEMTLRTAVLGPDGALSDERELDARVCECCPTAAARVPGGALVAYRDRGPTEVRDVSLLRLESSGGLQPGAVPRDGWEIPGCPVNGPAIAARGDRVALAWYTGAGDTARVLVGFSDDGGRTFGSPLRLDGGDPLGRVDLALLEDGSALVCWLETAGKEALVQVRAVAESGAMSPPLTVARTASSRGSGYPRLAVGQGRVVFAWTEAGKPSRVRVASARLR